MALGTTGITTSLVANTLGTSSHNVSALCKHSNINKWSKKKPVEINNPAPNRSSDWWKGDNGCCGFNQDSILFDTKDYLISAYNNGTTYVYEKPTTYKRLADFGGYEHTATSPCWSIDVEGMIYADSPSSYIRMVCSMNNVISLTNINLQDLAPLTLVDVSNCYFGCLIVYGAYTYAKTSANKIGVDGMSDLAGNNSVSISCSEFSTVGTHNIYPAIFSLPYTTLTSNMSGTKFIAIPTPTSGNFTTSFTVKNSVYEGSIDWQYAWVNQGVNLTMGGTIMYASRFEGSNVTVSYIKQSSNGTKTTLRTETVTLAKTGTNGNNYLMEVETSMKQSTEDGDTFWMKVTLSTYEAQIQCDVVLLEDIL